MQVKQKRRPWKQGHKQNCRGTFALRTLGFSNVQTSVLSFISQSLQSEEAERYFFSKLISKECWNNPRSKGSQSALTLTLSAVQKNPNPGVSVKGISDCHPLQFKSENAAYVERMCILVV